MMIEDEGNVENIRIEYGGMEEKKKRENEVENEIMGKKWKEEKVEEEIEEYEKDYKKMKDMREKEEYRMIVERKMMRSLYIEKKERGEKIGEIRGEEE